MATPRTFNVGMHGDDVKNWQKTLVESFHEMRMLNVPLAIDGNYGPVTRALSAQLAKCLGIDNKKLMLNGLTIGERRKLKAVRLTAAERARFTSTKYKEYRARVRKAWAAAAAQVHRPVVNILADSWGYHPGVHDGLDVICPPDVPIFAMVKAKVVDVRASGWWGLGAPANAALKAKGDGIIQLEVLESVGPFKKGMHIGYGHAEKAKVRVGQTVKAGQVLGNAGFANAWHIHLMVNDGTKGTRGVGNIDPRPLLDYAVKNGS